MADSKEQREENNSPKGAVTRLETRAHGTTKTEVAGDSLQGAKGNNCQLYI